MSRSWATTLLAAYADVLTAVFWPGPVNGLTVLFILAVDAVLLVGLLVVPKLIATSRDADRMVANADEYGRIREAEFQLRRMTQGGGL